MKHSERPAAHWPGALACPEGIEPPTLSLEGCFFGVSPTDHKLYQS